MQTSDPEWEPVFVVGDSSGFETTHALDIKSIKAGNDHTCVLADNLAYGTPFPTDVTLCWGRNHLGQLGQGSDRSHFVDDFQYLSTENMYGGNALTTPPEIDGYALGGEAMCYVSADWSTDPAIRCLGNQQSAVNGVGRVGAGHLTQTAMDIQSGVFQVGHGGSGDMLIADVTQPVGAISMPDMYLGSDRASHGCALMPATSTEPVSVLCYGEYIAGQQTNFAPLTGTPVDVMASNYAACVLTDAGEVGCWGTPFNIIDTNDDCTTYGQTQLANNGIFGQSCTGTFQQSVQTLPLSGSATAIHLNMNGGCASLDDGSIECWGAVHPTWPTRHSVIPLPRPSTVPTSQVQCGNLCPAVRSMLSQP